MTLVTPVQFIETLHLLVYVITVEKVNTTKYFIFVRTLKERRLYNGMKAGRKKWPFADIIIVVFMSNMNS